MKYPQKDAKREKDEIAICYRFLYAIKWMWKS